MSFAILFFCYIFPLLSVRRNGSLSTKVRKGKRDGVFGPWKLIRVRCHRHWTTVKWMVPSILLKWYKWFMGGSDLTCARDITSRTTFHFAPRALDALLTANRIFTESSSFLLTGNRIAEFRAKLIWTFCLRYAKKKTNKQQIKNMVNIPF